MDAAIFDNYSKYPLFRLSELGLHISSIEFLSEIGLPEWSAPNMYFGEEDCWLPELTNQNEKFAVLGSDRDDNQICISLSSNEIFRLNDLTLDFVATKPALLGLALKEFQLCINAAVLANDDAFTENNIPSFLLKPFVEWLTDNEPKALIKGSFWQSTLNWLRYT
jgi:hypothetical protein